MRIEGGAPYIAYHPASSKVCMAWHPAVPFTPIHLFTLINSAEFSQLRKMANLKATAPPSVLVLVLLITLAGTWLFQRRRHNSRYKLPPHVPGVPVFGNTFQVPPVQQGPWAKNLAEKYGEMYVILIRPPGSTSPS